MKNSCFIAFLLVATTISAQRFDGGIIIGLSGNQIDGDALAGFNKGGAVLGFFAETEINRNFFFMGEVEYYGKGAAVSSNNNSKYGKRSLHYIEVPVSLNYLYSHKVSAHAGLAASYFFSGKQEGTIYDNKAIDFYKKLDVGWLAGIGYQLTKKVGFRIRYTYSLFTISKDKVSGDSYSWLARSLGYTKGDYNNSVQLSILYKLN